MRLSCGRGDFGGNVDPHLAALHDVLPARAGTMDGEVVAFNAGGDLGRRHRQVIELEAGKGALDEFDDEARRADLGQLGDIGDEVGFADGRLNLEDPAARANAALVFDIAVVEEALHGVQRDVDGLGGHHDFEMTADVLIERGETGVEIPVIVGGQRARMHFEAEGAKGARQARHFPEQLLRMGVLAEQEMAQRGKIGIEGVQEPVLCDVAGRHARLENAVALLLFLGEDGALLIENFDEAAQHAGQCGAGIDVDAGRNEDAGSASKRPGAVAQQAHNGQVHVAIGEFAHR